MEEPETTPGPWRWWGCKDGSYEPMNDYAQIAAGRVHVAQVRLASVTEADLRLMAAAPDMLNALRSLLRHAERMSEIMDEECGIRFRDDGPMAMARDAMTRAVGAA